MPTGSKPYTLEHVKSELYKLNPNLEILSDKYTKAREKLILKCNIDGYIFEKSWNKLKNGQGCPKCKGFMRNQSISDIKKRIKEISPNIEVLEDEYIDATTKMKLRCNIDGHEWMASLNKIQVTKDKKFANGCPICGVESIRKMQLTPNDENRFSNIRPDLIKYFEKPSDADDYTIKSSRKANLKCIHCGFKKQIAIYSFVSQGFSCPICSDGISLPEKMMSNVLKELDISFKTDCSLEWSMNKRYDFFIPSLNMIIETHGMQHYKECNFGRTIEEEEQNDYFKYRIALDNNIEKYIVVDCRYSDFNWIKDNICKSLTEYFKLESINFEDLYRNSCDTIMPKVWESFNNMTKKEIQKEFNLSYSCVNRYLKIGEDLGIVKNRNECKKSVDMLDLNGKFIESFESVSSASKYVGCRGSDISSCLTGKQKSTRGFKWRYKIFDNKIVR